MTIGDVRGVGSQPEDAGRITGADTSQPPKEEKIQQETPEAIVKDQVTAKDWDKKIRLDNELRDLKERLGKGDVASWQEKGVEYSLVKPVTGTKSQSYVLVRKDSNQSISISEYREGESGLVESKNFCKLIFAEGKYVQVDRASIKAEPDGRMPKEETKEAVPADPQVLEAIWSVMKIAKHPLAQIDTDVPAGALAAGIEVEEFAQDPLLRKAEEGEANKSKDGKVVINGQVLNLDFVPLEYASAGLLGSVDAIMKRADNDPEKVLLDEKIKDAQVKIKEFVAKHPEIKDNKKVLEELFALNLSGGILAEIFNKGAKAEIVSPNLFSTAAQFYAAYNESKENESAVK